MRSNDDIAAQLMASGGLGQGQSFMNGLQQASVQSAAREAAYQRSLHNQYQQNPWSAQQSRGKQNMARTTYMGQAWPRQPIPVRCDGWQSDTLTLERHGYQFMVDHDLSRMMYRIAIGKAGCKSMIVIDDLNYDQYLSSGRPLEFHGEFMTGMEVRYYGGSREPQFTTVSMNDAYFCEREVEMNQRRIDVRDLFPQSQTAEDSMIVLPDQQTVKDALEVILEMQEPRQQEIKENQRRREAVAKTHAQIVTLEEVA